MICCDCKLYMPDDHFPWLKSGKRKSQRCVSCTAGCQLGQNKSHNKRRNWSTSHKSFGFIEKHTSLQRPGNRLSDDDLRYLKFGQ